MKKEIRTIVAEIRMDGENTDSAEKRKITGYAAVFDKPTNISERLQEKIAKGAFSDSVSGDIRALWNHNDDFPLGRTSSGTLKLREDNFGLQFELDLPNTQVGNDVLEMIRRGDVNGMSFGFMVRKDSWERGDQNKPYVRTLEKVDLIEVSPVTFPAYPQTSVSARSAEEMIAEFEAANKPEEKASEPTPDLSIVYKRKRLDLRARGI
jgi:HK97 family phage prohead protease